MSGIQAFMQLIICYRMQHAIVYPTTVIAMDHFTHQPKIRFHSICHLTHRMHKSMIQYICRIQTDSINIKGIDPETDHIKKILHHLRISLI